MLTELPLDALESPLDALAKIAAAAFVVAAFVVLVVIVVATGDTYARDIIEKEHELTS